MYSMAERRTQLSMNITDGLIVLSSSADNRDSMKPTNHFFIDVVLGVAITVLSTPSLVHMRAS